MLSLVGWRSVLHDMHPIKWVSCVRSMSSGYCLSGGIASIASAVYSRTHNHLRLLCVAGWRQDLLIDSQSSVRLRSGPYDCTQLVGVRLLFALLIICACVVLASVVGLTLSSLVDCH